MLIELALWGTICTLLSAIGYNWDSWQFWCFLGTYWAVSVVSRGRGHIEGIIDFLEMSDNEQARIKQALKEAKEGSK